MKRATTIFVLFAVVGIAACDRPTVVTTPAATVAVPVAVPGPPGPAGSTGATGATGATGQEGTGTTVVVTPPAPAASN